jgi:hypothetical protein
VNAIVGRGPILMSLRWYLRPGFGLLPRLIALIFWLYIGCSAAINVSGVLANVVVAQFVRSVENGHDCGLPLWWLLGRVSSPDVTPSFPGIADQGLFNSVIIFGANVALLLTARYVLLENPARALRAVGTPKLALLRFNLFASVCVAIIFAFQVGLGLVVLLTLNRIDPALYDVNLPGTCSWTAGRS